MMYEVLQQYIMLMAVSVRGTFEELEAYAARVAGGYRPPVLEKWPEEVKNIIKVSTYACSPHLASAALASMRAPIPPCHGCKLACLCMHPHNAVARSRHQP